MKRRKDRGKLKRTAKKIERASRERSVKRSDYTREEWVTGHALAQTVDQSYERVWVWLLAASDFLEAKKKIEKGKL